jgi:hypothetical protein
MLESVRLDRAIAEYSVDGVQGSTFTVQGSAENLEP